MAKDEDDGGRAVKEAGDAKPRAAGDGDQQATQAKQGKAANDAADAAARRMAKKGHKPDPLAAVVEHEGHLQASESDATVVGLQLGGAWLIATHRGQPVSLASATVGHYSGSRDASVVEMRSATKGDDGWKLGDHSSGMLVTGDGATAKVLGEIAKGSGKSWTVHGKHGAKDKLPAELVSIVQENDHLDLGGHFYAWMSYPEGKGAENPAGWASTGHDKKQVDGRVTSFRADAEKLPEPLRTQVLEHVETIAVVSATEGGYDATSGQVKDTSGSLGIFQWARSRDPDKGADSLDKFFTKMAQRAESAEKKLKAGLEPSGEELAALDAWEQAQKMGIGVKDGRTTIKQGDKTKVAGGLDLELAAAGSAGLSDSYQVSQALRKGSNVDGALADLRKHKPKKQSAVDEKKGEVALLDGLIGQLGMAMRDVMASDLMKDDPTYQPSLEKQLAALEKKEEKKEEEKKEGEKEDEAAVEAALDKEIKDKAGRIKAAEPVLRRIIDKKLRHAPGMAGDEMRKYQLVAALDWIKDFQAHKVFPTYEPYRSSVLPQVDDIAGSSATLKQGGHSLHLQGVAGSTVGDHMKSEKALAEMSMLGVNRPAYVATALWASLQSGSASEQVKTHLGTVFGAVEKLGGKKGDLSEAALQKLLASPAKENEAEAEAAQKAVAELKGILWPGTGKEDEGALITRFRAEAMRIYNTVEKKDADEYNRVGRFVTVELIDWNAVEAAKAKH